jgi:hypothetical protein
MQIETCWLFYLFSFYGYKDLPFTGDFKTEQHTYCTVYVVYPCVAKKNRDRKRRANKLNKKEIKPKANGQKQGQQKKKYTRPE